MKAVFAHDHKFRRIDGEYYSPGGLPDDVLSRYVGWFGEVTVVGRVIDETQAKPNYSRIKSAGISVVTGEKVKAAVRDSDCVIARLPSLNGYKAIGYAKKYNKPYLVEVVGCTFDAYWNYGIKGKILAAPAYLVMRYCVRNAPYALYVTSKFLQRRYPCRGKTIGVSDVAIENRKEPDHASGDEASNGQRARAYDAFKDFCASGSALRIGTLAAVDVAYKGQAYVIGAIQQIEKDLGVRVEYELVGGGSPNRLQKIAEDRGVKDRVRFTGSMPHDRVFSWLDSLDCYIQPSMLEGLSRALVEAMSRGLPCVASDCGGNPELLEQNRVVKLRPYDSYSHRIAKTVCSIFEADCYQGDGDRNAAFANEWFSTDRLDELRDGFYRSFAAQVERKDMVKI